MKRSLVAGILGLLCTTASFGQGRIRLDTYNTAPYPQITFGGNWSGVQQGTPVTGPHGGAPYTVGFYWAAGNLLGTVSAYTPGDPWVSSPSWWGFTLATGLGATTVMGQNEAAGWFWTPYDCVLPGVSSGDVTIIVALYDRAFFDISFHRHLSVPFVMTPAQGGGLASAVGVAMPTFELIDLPEPSAFALLGLGFTALLMFRRRSGRD